MEVACIISSLLLIQNLLISCIQILLRQFCIFILELFRSTGDQVNIRGSPQRCKICRILAKRLNRNSKAGIRCIGLIILLVVVKNLLNQILMSCRSVCIYNRLLKLFLSCISLVCIYQTPVITVIIVGKLLFSGISCRNLDAFFI